MVKSYDPLQQQKLPNTAPAGMLRDVHPTPPFGEHRVHDGGTRRAKKALTCTPQHLRPGQVCVRCKCRKRKLLPK